MRLLDTVTGQFVEKDPRDPKTKYAILSHTWDSDGEQTYQEVCEIQKQYAPHRGDGFRSGSGRPSSSPVSPVSRSQNPPSPSRPSEGDENTLMHILPVTSEAPLSPIWDDPKLSSKVREACRIARENGYRYIWIDSCCIDKSSSSELSEAINSMYEWYARADVCYAFLADVSRDEEHSNANSSFRKARWFKRGWTLQELIAPMAVIFLSRDWTAIGSKYTLVELVVAITNISYNALLHVEPLDSFSVAERLSWAARRETTRVEDRSYSLLGIFGINMPTLYGEGSRAFRRLQQEILQRTPDQSIFAWGSIYRGPYGGSESGTTSVQQQPPTFSCRPPEEGPHSPSLLAPSLDQFADSGSIVAISYNELVRRLQECPNLPAIDYAFTPHGIRTQVPLIQFSHYVPTGATTKCPDHIPLSQFYLLILGCEDRGSPGHLMGRFCYIPRSGSTVEFLYSVDVCIFPAPIDLPFQFNLLPFTPPTTAERSANPQADSPPTFDLRTIYIFHARPDNVGLEVAIRLPHKEINLVLLEETRAALAAQGYTVTLRKPNSDRPATHSVSLANVNNNFTITVDYRHTIESDGCRLTIIAQAKVVEFLSSGSPYQTDDVSKVSWVDSIPWHVRLDKKQLTLSRTGGKTVTMDLDLHLTSPNHYTLRIEILRDASEIVHTSEAIPSPDPDPRPQPRSGRFKARWLERLSKSLTKSTRKLLRGARERGQPEATMS